MHIQIGALRHCAGLEVGQFPALRCGGFEQTLPRDLCEHLGGDEWIAARPHQLLVQSRTGLRAAESGLRQFGEGLAVERRQGQSLARDALQAHESFQAPGARNRAGGDQHCDTAVGGSADDRPHHLHALVIGPLGVLEDDQQRVQPFDQSEHRLDGRIDDHVADVTTAGPEQPLEPIVGSTIWRRGQHPANGGEWQVLLTVLEVDDEPGDPVLLGEPRGLGDQTGLADPGFTHQLQYPAAASSRRLHQRRQTRALGRTPHQSVRLISHLVDSSNRGRGLGSPTDDSALPRPLASGRVPWS